MKDQPEINSSNSNSNNHSRKYIL